MRLKPKQKGPSKQTKSIKQNKYCFDLFKSKAPECFKVDSKQQRNLKNIEHCQINTLHRERRNHLSESSTEPFESRLKCKTFIFVDSKTSSCTLSVGESASRQSTRGHRVCEKPFSTRVLDCCIEKRIKETQVDMCQFSAQKRQPNSSIDGGSTPRMTGVDYFGSLDVKSLRHFLRRRCCLFICLTTRAVHI